MIQSKVKIGAFHRLWWEFRVHFADCPSSNPTHQQATGMVIAADYPLRPGGYSALCGRASSMHWVIEAPRHDNGLGPVFDICRDGQPIRSNISLEAAIQYLIHNAEVGDTYAEGGKVRSVDLLRQWAAIDVVALRETGERLMMVVEPSTIRTLLDLGATGVGWVTE